MSATQILLLAAIGAGAYYIYTKNNTATVIIEEQPLQPAPFRGPKDAPLPEVAHPFGFGPTPSTRGTIYGNNPTF